MQKKPRASSKRAERIKISTATAPVAQRGRPSQEQIKTDIEKLIDRALNVMRGHHYDGTEMAERLLSGSDWPGIQEMQETAKRLVHYEGLSAWQALISLMGGVVDSELAWIETCLRKPTCRGAEKTFLQLQITFLDRYVIEGVSLRALEREFDRDQSSIKRDFKDHIYHDLTTRALKMMRGEIPLSSHVAAHLRDDVPFSRR